MSAFARATRRLAALAFVAAPLAAQVAVPAGWQARVDGGGMDHGDGGKVTMVVMKPGWHVTTGPAAILWSDAMRARGDWRLEATLFLFNPGGRAEGFGVFFGGSDLASPRQRYGYALLRRDGRALLKVRDGAATRTVRDWTAHPAIPVFAGTGPNANVKYPLVVEARGDRVMILVGGTKVLDAPRAELPADGTVGLRINHALNVHVESIAVVPLAKR